MVRLGRRNKEFNEFLWGRGTGAKHCSSLCSQSEGDGYVANLSEIYCRLCGAAAPVRGSYSRIGARPYLPPQLIDSRCCPCKGRISLAGLAPQQDSRYEPLTGARFINRPQEVGASPYPKYEPLTGAIPRTRAARQFVNSFNSLLRCLRPTNELRRSPQPRCKNSINSNLRRERPERAASSQPRAADRAFPYNIFLDFEHPT